MDVHDEAQGLELCFWHRMLAADRQPWQTIAVVNQPPSENHRAVGRYMLFGEIASGGMATVRFGRLMGEVGFSRTVAVKCLHAQFAKDREFARMFIDEARLAARIRHPNVVPVLDVVARDGELFLIMDYVQGESLSKLIRAVRAKKTPIPPRIVAAVMAGALDGLHAAHEACSEQGEPLGIVHRDVSPQNVMVGLDGVSRVLDFGVAKAAGRLQTTQKGQLKGKLAYMAPEQLRAEPVDRRTDVYAASVVLWEALTSQRLFKAEDDVGTFGLVLKGDVPPPSSIIQSIPSGYDEVTLRGLHLDSSKRFSTAREMAVALERVAGIASPREVGAWVEEMARDPLRKRAARIAELESVSSVDLRQAIQEDALRASGPVSSPALDTSELRASTGDVVALEAIDVITTGTNTTTGSLGSVDVAPQKRTRQWRLLWLGLAAAVLVGATWFFARQPTQPPNLSDGAADPEVEAPAPAAIPSTASSSSTASASSAASSSSAPSSSSTASTASSSEAPGSSTRSLPGRTAQTAAPPAPPATTRHTVPAKSPPKKYTRD